MTREQRTKLSMAARALDFAEAHPSTDASCNALVARLKDRVTRADALAIQQRGGHVGEQAAIAHRTAAMDVMHQVQLRHLVGVARMAAKEHPELLGMFRLPAASGGSHRGFITAAKALLAAAELHQDMFLELGLGDTFLADLTASVNQFDQGTTDAHTGRRDHVGARADLKTIANECVQLAGLLDGLYQLRFRNDPESLAAWESSKNVAGPFKTKAQDPVPSPAPVPAPAPAPSPAVDPVVNPGTDKAA